MASIPPNYFPDSDEGWLPDSPPGYRLEERIGHGSQGQVYRACRLQDGAVVAIKLIASSRGAGDEAEHRLKREIGSLKRIESEYVLRLLDHGTYRGWVYLVLEYAAGGHCFVVDRFSGKADGPVAKLGLRERIEFLRRVAEGVAAVHRDGVVHRDIKPSNVLVGDLGYPKLADFGVIRPLEQSVTLTDPGQQVGTFHYMAPEQFLTRTDGAAKPVDVWALGVLLYLCLALRHPFLRSFGSSVPEAILAAVPPWETDFEPGVDPRIAGICLKCLQRAPNRRYPDAEALLADLERYQSGKRPVARPAFRWMAKCLRWTRRPQARLLLVGLAMLLVLGLAGTAWVQARGRMATERARTKEMVQSASKRGDPAAAKRGLQDLQRLGEPRGSWLLLAGEVAMDQSNPSEAIPLLTEAVKLQPRSVAGHALAALANLDHHRFAAFADHLLRMLRLEAVSPEDWLHRGRALALMDPEESLRSIDRALASRRDWPLARKERGATLTLLARDRGSLERIEEAVAELEMARKYLEMPATADPLLTHAHLRARVLQLEAGNAAAARLHAELADAAARRVFGTNLPSHMHTTQLEEVGRVEEALLIAPAWKAAGQHHKQVWTRHISLLLARGQDAEAGTWLAEVQEDDHLSDTQWWIWKTRTLGPDAAALDMPDLKRRYDSPELSGVHVAALWLHLRRPERCQTQAREFLARHREMLTRLPNHNALYIAEFLAGERTADSLMESAGASRVARCNNRFYIAWQCWARGDATAARREWQAVVATGLYDLSSHRFAKILLAEKEG